MKLLIFFRNEIKNKDKLIGKNNKSFIINNKIFVKHFTGDNFKKIF